MIFCKTGYEQTLLEFFEQVARKDKIQLKKLEHEKVFSVTLNKWCFTLPDLFTFIQHQYDIFNTIDYARFRRLIFNTPINQTVKLYGAEISIVNNQGKVDQSNYALVWKTCA